MKVFECNSNIGSFKFPIVKIIICVFLVILLISRNHFIRINNSLWNTIIGIVCLLVVLSSILCIYLSIGEIILLNERRVETKTDIASAINDGRNYSVKCILSILEANSIIDISILSSDQIIKIGASADCHQGSSRFFDKAYYINDRNGISIEELQEIINSYSVDNEVCVISIDGAPPTFIEGD